jgi:hypothetical protein
MIEGPPGRARATTTTTTRENVLDDGDAYFEPRDAERARIVLGGPPLGSLPSDTPTTERPPTHPAARDVRAPPLSRYQSAIRLRRLRGPTVQSQQDFGISMEQEPLGGRRRSSSEPQRLANPGTAWSALPPVTEASSSHQTREHGITPATTQAPGPAAVPQGAPAGKQHRHPPWAGRRRLTVQDQPLSQEQARDCYDSRIVDFLDVVGEFLLLAKCFSWAQPSSDQREF